MRKNHLSSTKLVKGKQITIHELSKSITFLNFKKSLVKSPTCELQYDRLSTKIIINSVLFHHHPKTKLFYYFKFIW